MIAAERTGGGPYPFMPLCFIRHDSSFCIFFHSDAEDGRHKVNGVEEYYKWSLRRETVIWN